MNVQDINDFAFIAHELAQPDTRPILQRKQLSDRLLSLFRADFLGQTLWNSITNSYEKPICYNRDQDMSVAYERYYQFCDPISPKIRQRNIATPTYEVISRRELEQSEYFFDFLNPFKVKHGMDIYLFDEKKNIGDLRIWRESADHEFTTREKTMLSALRPMLINAYRPMLSGEILEESVNGSSCLALSLSSDLRRHVYSSTLLHWIEEQPGLTEQALLETVVSLIAIGKVGGSFNCFTVQIGRRNVTDQSQCAYMCTIRPTGLGTSGDSPTKREREVGRLIAAGLTDQEIAHELGISYWTVRTHVGSLLKKYSARNRVEFSKARALDASHH